MRDKRFITEHRGGSLTREQHRQLIIWAGDCAEHIMLACNEISDRRLANALLLAREWAKGNATVGEARKAAMEAIAVANDSSNPALKAVARSVGHAVATAHMADHSLKAAEYALKTARLAGCSTDAERKWQDEHLGRGIIELVHTAVNKQAE